MPLLEVKIKTGRWKPFGTGVDTHTHTHILSFFTSCLLRLHVPSSHSVLAFAHTSVRPFASTRTHLHLTQVSALLSRLVPFSRLRFCPFCTHASTFTSLPLSFWPPPCRVCVCVCVRNPFGFAGDLAIFSYRRPDLNKQALPPSATS